MITCTIVVSFVNSAHSFSKEHIMAEDRPQQIKINLKKIYKSCFLYQDQNMQTIHIPTKIYSQFSCLNPSITNWKVGGHTWFPISSTTLCSLHYEFQETGKQRTNNYECQNYTSIPYKCLV